MGTHTSWCWHLPRFSDNLYALICQTLEWTLWFLLSTRGIYSYQPLRENICPTLRGHQFLLYQRLKHIKTCYTAYLALFCITMHSEKFTPFHAQDIPDLSGYVAIVTGGTTPLVTLRCSHFDSRWPFTWQATQESDTKPHSNLLFMAPESILLAARPTDSERPWSRWKHPARNHSTFVHSR